MVVLPDDWVGEILQAYVRTALPDRTYFRVLVTATPHLIRALQGELHYALSVEIESGPQYRLGDVHFANRQGSPLAFQ
jgi:outer membrane protein assembly factor BamA